MKDSALTVPDPITFEAAIALTQSLVSHLEQGNISEAEVEQLIGALVKTEAGARGFFVTYLTGDSALADRPSEAVVDGLNSSPEIVAELLVKNLAMSTAMAISHRRQQHEAMAQGSERVRSRTTCLIQQLPASPLSEKLQTLRDTIATGKGDYQSFLSRWGYDAEQQQAIADVLETCLDGKNQ